MCAGVIGVCPTAAAAPLKAGGPTGGGGVLFDPGAGALPGPAGAGAPVVIDPAVYAPAGPVIPGK
jgi:hypothetical protein